MFNRFCKRLIQVLFFQWASHPRFFTKCDFLSLSVTKLIIDSYIFTCWKWIVDVTFIRALGRRKIKTLSFENQCQQKSMQVSPLWQLALFRTVGTAGSWQPGAELSVTAATGPCSFLFSSKPSGRADGVQPGWHQAVYWKGIFVWSCDAGMHSCSSLPCSGTFVSDITRRVKMKEQSIADCQKRGNPLYLP